MFVWMFVELPDLRLRHLGKQECLALIDLMEDRWDQLMLFDPSLYGMTGSISSQHDPQQVYGVRGRMPEPPPKKFQDTNSLRGQTLGFANEYELKMTEAYLKANSPKDQQLTIFPVSGR